VFQLLIYVSVTSCYIKYLCCRHFHRVERDVVWFYAGLTRDAGAISSSSNSKWITSAESEMRESRVNNGRTEAVACNMILPAGAPVRSHLTDIVTSSSSSLFTVYTEALAWLRQLHAMCAGADAPFPLPLPPMTLPEPAYYVTKMAAGVRPMQPFDPRWDSCPSPSQAPCVDPPAARDPPSSGGHVGGRARDFSIPSILSRSGSSSTGADSDATTESEERCQSTSSSLDDLGGVMTSRRHTMTSYDNVERAPVELTSHQKRRQQDRQQFECPQCNKVLALWPHSEFVALSDSVTWSLTQTQLIFKV